MPGPMTDVTDRHVAATRDRVAARLAGRERELVLSVGAAGSDIVLERPPGTSKTTILQAMTAEWVIPLLVGGQRRPPRPRQRTALSCYGSTFLLDVTDEHDRDLGRELAASGRDSRFPSARIETSPRPQRRLQWAGDERRWMRRSDGKYT